MREGEGERERFVRIPPAPSWASQNKPSSRTGSRTRFNSNSRRVHGSQRETKRLYHSDRVEG